MGEPGISCMEPFLKKKRLCFFPVCSGVYSHGTGVCYNLKATSHSQARTGPLREFHCFCQILLQIFIYLQYLLTMKHMKMSETHEGTEMVLCFLQRNETAQ